MSETLLPKTLSCVIFRYQGVNCRFIINPLKPGVKLKAAGLFKYV